MCTTIKDLVFVFSICGVIWGGVWILMLRKIKKKWRGVLSCLKQPLFEVKFFQLLWFLILISLLVSKKELAEGVATLTCLRQHEGRYTQAYLLVEIRGTWIQDQKSWWLKDLCCTIMAYIHTACFFDLFGTQNLSML